MNRKMAAVISAPLEAGDNIPSIANTAMNNYNYITIVRKNCKHHLAPSKYIRHCHIMVALPITKKAEQKSCIPEPIREANRRELRGGLNTSPCTSFQPVSSNVSSYNK